MFNKLRTTVERTLRLKVSDAETIAGYPFSETDYLSMNPDVRAAVSQGIFPSGRAHFTLHGLQEGRLGLKAWRLRRTQETIEGHPFLETDYLAMNPDVREAVKRGNFPSGRAHFIKHGLIEGRIGIKPRRLAHQHRDPLGLPYAGVDGVNEIPGGGTKPAPIIDKETARKDLQRFFTESLRPNRHQIGWLEQRAKAFDTIAEVQALVPNRPLLQNLIGNVWEYAHGETRLTTYPWNVSIPVADVCNARCTFCTSWLEGRQVLDLKLLDTFAPVLRHALYVGLVGHGEPLAHPQFDQLCDRLSSLLDPLASCYTITNGVFLAKWRDRLKNILDSYSISLNAATPETHDKVMGLGVDALPGILDSIRWLTHQRRKHRETNVYITMVVNQDNVHEIPAFIELGNRLKVTEIWLRSLLPQSGRIPGLNYHLLPAYLHPNFDRLRANALKAIRASRIPVQADPRRWSDPVFPRAVESAFKAAPPPFVTRALAQRDREIRQRADGLYVDDKISHRGEALDETAMTEVRWFDGKLQVKTPIGSGAYAISLPLAVAAACRRNLAIDVEVLVGVLGIDIWSDQQSRWIERKSATPGRRTILVPLSDEDPGKLILNNHSIDPIRTEVIVHGARLIDTARGTNIDIDWSQMVIHNAVDPLEDGTNPMKRQPRFACNAVYHNLYVNEFFYRMPPCCYMTRVPGFDEIRFDRGVEFMEVWNAPALVELRRRLKEGPLFSACRRCPAEW